MAKFVPSSRGIFCAQCPGIDRTASDHSDQVTRHSAFQERFCHRKKCRPTAARAFVDDRELGPAQSVLADPQQLVTTELGFAGVGMSSGTDSYAGSRPSGMMHGSHCHCAEGGSNTSNSNYRVMRRRGRNSRHHTGKVDRVERVIRETLRGRDVDPVRRADSADDFGGAGSMRALTRANSTCEGVGEFRRKKCRAMRLVGKGRLQFTRLDEGVYPPARSALELLADAADDDMTRKRFPALAINPRILRHAVRRCGGQRGSFGRFSR